MKGSKAKLQATSTLPKPNAYVQLMVGEYKDNCFTEDQAPSYKSKWLSDVLKNQSSSLDVEIGTGNGFHFAHKASEQKDRGFVGIEVKYKPLVQTIRRALLAEANPELTYMVRYNAYCIDELFAEEEIDNLYIHHPDPWPKERQWKHRLIQDDFLQRVYPLQKMGSFLEFKTDDLLYFEWSLERFKRSKYKVEFETFDLHNSEKAPKNFITHFEKIFLKKGQPIYYALLKKG